MPSKSKLLYSSLRVLVGVFLIDFFFFSLLRYTYGQPVPGQALVEVCREPFPYSVVPDVSHVCLIKTTKVCDLLYRAGTFSSAGLLLNLTLLFYQMNNTGCASLTFSTSEFFNTKFENDLQDSFVVKVNVTEEGTGELLADLLF